MSKDAAKADRPSADRKVKNAEEDRIEAEYSTPPETHNPLEPHATLAVWNGDHLTLYDATLVFAGPDVWTMTGFERLEAGDGKSVCHLQSWALRPVTEAMRRAAGALLSAG